MLFWVKVPFICLGGEVSPKFIRYTWAEFALTESDFKKKSSNNFVLLQNPAEKRRFINWRKHVKLIDFQISIFLKEMLFPAE